ncbi:MAG TPA: tRNA (adenosine(37)-N6)-threonylcarbamoyltransferase complex dimerization subunit type 1 TsaB [Acidiphilium sp.]|nr:tRNA (adenosine(37)-N6)-threonylcarbamoyltransferase complex dimerization subunit type 1 TsaB [Acidiphilium sp.]HQU23654.1 tRNA (adenosine(37)-N6)-threonylcarbamoyltransferase complex dimerization subunit type 1 TsaB [Acidiphilium sp.]
MMSGGPPHRILALDASGAQASIGIVDGNSLLAHRQSQSGSGLTDRLVLMLAETLRDAAIDPQTIDAIAVIVGPGSFTGIRAALALAHGFGQTAHIPVHGVRLTESFQQDLPNLTRPLWVAATARRSQVFLERDGIAASFAEDALPSPSLPIALAGERAITVAARLAARDANILLTSARVPSLCAIAGALRDRLGAGGVTIPPLPLYVDPPEAKLPAAGLRPAPV